MRRRRARLRLLSVSLALLASAFAPTRSALAQADIGSGDLAPESAGAAASDSGSPLSRPDARPLLVSRVSGGGRPSEAAQAGMISANGRFAAFVDGSEIFIRDLHTASTRRVGPGSSPVLSADGDSLAYSADGKAFVRDLRTGARSLVSARLSAGGLSIAADGRYVAFAATDPDLSDQGDSPYQVYLRDLKRKTTTLISRAGGAGGAIGDAESTRPSISANGRYVAFSSEAGNLLPGTPRGTSGVYVRDLSTGKLRRVSYWHSKPGPRRGDASQPALSANGRFVAFSFTRFGGPSSVVVRDLRTGATVNASLLTRTPLKLAFGAPAISAAGRFVAFRAASPEGKGLERLYLVDLRSRRTRYVGEVSTSEGGPLSFSADGRYLLFDTFVDSNVPKGSEPLIPASGEVYRYTNPFRP